MLTRLCVGLSERRPTRRIEAIRAERPDIRVVVYDHSFGNNLAWFRFVFKWSDPKIGEPRCRAGVQSYRIETGKLAETWLILLPLGWTSPPPG